MSAAVFDSGRSGGRCLLMRESPSEETPEQGILSVRMRAQIILFHMYTQKQGPPQQKELFFGCFFEVKPKKHKETQMANPVVPDLGSAISFLRCKTKKQRWQILWYQTSHGICHFVSFSFSGLNLLVVFSV